MTVEEVFKTLSSHSLKGVMLHEDMSDLFDFLNLHGYKRMSEYHAKHEFKGYKKLHRYYTSRYNRLIPIDEFSRPDVIPDSWYAHSKQDVDTNTKRTAVREAFNKWVAWEYETKTLYQQMYKELVDIGEIDTSIKVGDYIKDVSEELEKAQKMQINLQSVDYAMDCIIEVQDKLHDSYKSKMKTESKNAG